MITKHSTQHFFLMIFFYFIQMDSFGPDTDVQFKRKSTEKRAPYYFDTRRKESKLDISVLWTFDVFQLKLSCFGWNISKDRG